MENFKRFHHSRSIPIDNPWQEVKSLVPPKGYIMVGEYGSIRIWLLPSDKEGYWHLARVSDTNRLLDGLDYNVEASIKPVLASGIELVLSHLEPDYRNFRWKIRKSKKVYSKNIWAGP